MIEIQRDRQDRYIYGFKKKKRCNVHNVCGLSCTKQQCLNVLSVGVHTVLLHGSIRTTVHHDEEEKED